MAPRKQLDDVFLRYGIIRDYKEMSRFLHGILNGVHVAVVENIKRSQFMKLVFKGALRESIKNMIAFNNLGADTATLNLLDCKRDNPAFRFSHQIQKY